MLKTYLSAGGAGTAPALPAVDFDPDLLAQLLPDYRVILHNDDVHAMDEVVLALLKSVPGLSTEQAVMLMYEAHSQGCATVMVCKRESAEYFADRLGTFGLTITIEAVA